MKTYRIAIVLFIFLSFGFVTLTRTKVKILPKSEVIIYGKSNVNSFQCKYNSNYLEDEISVSALKSSDTRISLNDARIAIKSKGFDCGNRMITNDFKTILKTDDYDNINIELKQLEINKKFVMTWLNIQIAGITKEYIIPMAYDADLNNVKGSLRLNIKDFKLKSPKKLFGMIEVNDNVDINFNLFLQY